MTTITQLSQLDSDGIYSYADYLTWQLDETVELVRGKIMLMVPAPNMMHQRISRKLLRAIDTYYAEIIGGSQHGICLLIRVVV